MPLRATKVLRTFFKREREEMENLVLEYPTMRVIDCDMPHFFKQCNSTTCLPSFSESMSILDSAIEASVANGTIKEPGPVFGVNWR